MITTATKELVSAGESFLSDELLKAFTHVIIGKWIDMAAAAIVVYEWLITLDMELRFIWCSDASQKKKTFFTKVLYFVNRYGIIVDLILDGFCSYGFNVGACKTLHQVRAAATVLGLYVSEFILASRVCAVWKMNKIIILFLAADFIGSSTYVLTSFYLMLRPVEFFTILPFGGCLANIQESTLWISYTVLLIYDTVMLGLMGYPTIKEYKFSHGRTELMKRVYDEGVIFYVFLLLVDIVSVALEQTVRDNIFFFPIPARMLRSIVAARTVLHIREYSSREIRVCSTTEATSSIRFNRARGKVENEVEVVA